jgi:hypothetical protein
MPGTCVCGRSSSKAGVCQQFYGDYYFEKYMPYDKEWKAENSKKECNTVNRYTALCQGIMDYDDWDKYASTAAFAYHAHNFVNSDDCTAKFANGDDDYTVDPDDIEDDFAYLLAIAGLAFFV